MRVFYKFTLVVIATILYSGCTTPSKNLVTDSDNTVIYLVRHAEKADDGTRNPPLTKKGQARAIELYQVLKDERLSKIYSTDYKRTRETAEPTSKETGISISIYDPRQLEAFADDLRATKGEIILVTGHSNSTPTLANMIIQDDQYVQFDESEYSNLITITIKDGKITSDMSSYGEK